MSNKRKGVLVWGVLTVGILAIAAGLYGVVVQGLQGSAGGSTLTAKVTDEDRARGGEHASVVIVEYSDFECPACKYFFDIIKQLEADKEGEIKFVYRHFPLQQHRYARLAAQAAEAAGLQGRFWEMHDVLFERQTEWSKTEDMRAVLAEYASGIGLDSNVFLRDLDRSEVVEKIDRDIALGVKQNIKGTPTFFLNGMMVQFRSYEELKQLVEEELSK